MTKEIANIRPAVISDIQDMTNLLRLLFSIEADFEFNEACHQEGLRLMLENPKSCIKVAETGGIVVGMCTGQLLISTAQGGLSLLVEDMVVQENIRGQGIGSRLLQEVISWGFANGALRAQLLADKNNHQALGFYEKLGWKQTQLKGLRFEV